MMLLMRSIGRMRTPPNRAGVSTGEATGAAPGAGGDPAAPLPPAGAAAAPGVTMRSADSTSRIEAYFNGKTPIDMPFIRSMSNVEITSSQPSTWLRVPMKTSKLRRVSTRTKASGGSMGLRIDAISAAPMFSSGTITVP